MKTETQIVIELQDINDNLKNVVKIMNEYNERDKKAKGVNK